MELTQEAFDKIKADLTEARAQAAAAAKEAAGYKAQVEQIPTLQQQITQANERIAALGADKDAHLALVDAGVTDSSVRDYTLHLYGKDRAAAGDKAPEFKDWLTGVKAKPPAILAPFLMPAQAAAPATSGAPAPPAAPTAPAGVRTEAGTRPAPTPPSPYSPGSVASMSRDEFKAQRPQLVEALRGAR